MTTTLPPGHAPSCLGPSDRRVLGPRLMVASSPEAVGLDRTSQGPEDRLPWHLAPFPAQKQPS